MAERSKHPVTARALALALGFCALLLAVVVVAQQRGGGESPAADVAAPVLDRGEIALVIERTTGRPQVKVDEVSPSLLEGFWELNSEPPAAGSLLVSEDGRKLVVGRVFERTDRGVLEVSGSPARLARLESFGYEDFIAFTPEEVAPSTWVVVFTDVTCGYCKRMHSQIDDYMRAGIEVRYLPYPRYGKGSESWLRTSSAWCAEDRLAAMTDLKKDRDGGQPCAQEDALDRYAELADSFGIRATPTLVFPDGRKLEGYVQAKDLVTLLPPAEVPAAEIPKPLP